MSELIDAAKSRAVYILAVVAAALVGIVLIFGAFEVIGPSERAVKVTLGTPSEKVYSNGVHAKWPVISTFRTYDLAPITRDTVITTGADGAVSGDKQTLGVVYKTVWAYDPARIQAIVKNYPDTDVLANIVTSTVYEAIKAEIGKYKIDDLAKSTVAIGNAALSAAIDKLKPYPVLLSQVNVVNWDWSDDFDRAIKETLNQQQKVATAKAEADRVEQEQRAKAIIAEAGATANVATAQGEKDAAVLRAEAKRAEGQGIADYNRLVTQNLETEIRLRELVIAQTKADAQKIEAEKWNGVKVPDYLPLTAAGGIVQLPAGK